MRKQIVLIIAVLTVFLAHDAVRAARNACANNISVSNGALGSQDTGANTEVVQFDVS